jgi:hypothetical protein
MKLKKYLTMNESSIEDVVKVIKRDCKPFLKELEKVKNQGLLWRGSNQNITEYKKIKTRKDRRPKDTPKDVHDILDELFFKKFGWKVRSEGVFAHKVKGVVDHYGIPYIFFPIGKYRYVWHPKIKDLYNRIDFDYKLQSKMYNLKKIKEFAENVIEGYENSGLWIYFESKSGEITFQCESYYLFDDRYEYLIKKLVYGEKINEI